MKMKRWGKILLLAVMGLAVACSTSKSKTDPAGAGDGSTLDASTDSVPPADGDAPPVDGGAPATDSPQPNPPEANAGANTQAATETPAATDAPPPGDAAAPANTTASNSASSTSSASSEATESYTIKSGDTLMKIAFEATGDVYKWKEIYEANKDKISNPNQISAGVVLKISKSGGGDSSHDGEKYLIKKGDTLGTISSNVYGTKTRWKSIWENNKQLIRDPNKIFAGFYLYYTKDGNSTLASGTGDSGGAKRNSASEPPPAASVAPPGK